MLEKVGIELSEETAVPYHDKYFIVIQILFAKLSFFINNFFYFSPVQTVNGDSKAASEAKDTIVKLEGQAENYSWNRHRK